MNGLPIPPSLQKSLDSTQVEYTQLGASGLRVSWPILGALAMGAPTPLVPWLLDEEASIAVLKAAYDRGINTWDTADSYSNGISEEIIGKAIKKLNIPRQKVVIMTKCAFHVGEENDIFGPLFVNELNQNKDYVNQGGLTRNGIFNAVENSLARLGTTYIDVLQIQRFDPLTTPEETMRALHEVVQSGKVRYIGASSMWATQFAQLQFIAEKNGWTKFISMQNYYNLCYREEEREMNRFCKETGVGLVPWSPLFAGRLARPVGEETSLRSKRPSPHHPGTIASDEAIIRRVEEVAKKKGWKMSHVALVWLKSKGTVPIVGLNSVEKVQDVCELRGKALTDEEVKYLEEPYQARPVAGHS
ncbi:NADP-dependent oxidoreductase domain-containing protein [Penicillium hispanicum]|uniref:NADP-dependent oxidoreductase domain-containing protein n=1 Tax=Penicillium hispanicum TaxID=1080232 RepID=UPI002540663C|nr:NADP-dependent oxidoreductase domain-containing protein [Penicillium hispanicum]KAJ5587656.1 NADP-dependent oxidoreductase domain-containing protein [Penicillium hispanicum]